MTKVLIIDDDERFTSLAARHLGPAGFEVHAHRAMNGALETTKSINPDIVLLDIMLGDGLGFQVCREIRKDPLVYQTGIIFESSVSALREIEYALEQGADSFLAKPFTLDKLLNQLHSVQRIQQKAFCRDSVTELVNLDYFKRRVNHLLFREEHFALCFISIANLHAHRKIGGEEAVIQIRRDTVALLKRTIEYTHEHTGELCDCGNGDFMAIVGRDDYHGFVRLVESDFKHAVSETAIRRLESSLLRRNDGLNAPRSELELSADTAVTHTDHHTYSNAKQMFHALERLKHKHEHAHAVADVKSKRPLGHNKWIG